MHERTNGPELPRVPVHALDVDSTKLTRRSPAASFRTIWSRRLGRPATCSVSREHRVPSHRYPPFSHGTAIFRHYISPPALPTRPALHRREPPHAPALARSNRAKIHSPGNQPVEAVCEFLERLRGHCHIRQRPARLPEKHALPHVPLDQRYPPLRSNHGQRDPGESTSRAEIAAGSPLYGEMGRQKSDSPTCFRTASSNLRTDVRLMRLFQRNSSSICADSAVSCSRVRVGRKPAIGASASRN